jgi:hypothetical protein
MQVRARNQEHLVNLKQACPWLEEKACVELRDRDYRWRIIISPEEWEMTAAYITKEVTEYKNFKGECLDRVNEQKLDQEYESMLHQIWHQHMAYQTRIHKAVSVKP